MQQQPPQQQDIATWTYRITVLEQYVQQLKDQLQKYVLQSVNDLQLENIQKTVDRIEHEVQASKQQLTDQLKDMNTRLVSQEIAARERDEQQRKETDEMQIKALKWAVGIFVGIVVAVTTALLVYFFTHPGG